MFTILDYIKYYKNITLDEIKWNMMDNLLCSILAYLPVSPFNETRFLDDVCKEILKIKNPEKLGLMEPKAVQVAKLLLGSKRYQKMRLSNLIKIKNDNTQLGAVTFRINNITVISFEGTDSSIIGWLENFRLAYEYPTYTQKMATNYLKENVKILTDNQVYVVGHSKGGNLAMASVMESSKVIFNKIKKIYCFDGPGFKESEFKSLKYQNMSKKLVNVIPTGTIVGTLMYNKNYQVVKSNAFGINEHFPTTWNIFGEHFVEGNLSSVSKQIHASTTTGFKDLDPLLVEETVESLFKVLGKKKSSKWKFSLDDIAKIYTNIKGIDPKVFESLKNILDSMLSVRYNNKK